MSAITLFDLNGEQRFTGTSVGGGGAQPLVDLGVITAASLANGAVTLITPGAGQLVQVCLEYASLVAGDSKVGITIGPSAPVSASNWLFVMAGLGLMDASGPQPNPYNFNTAVPYSGWIGDGSTPIKAALETPTSGLLINAAPAAAWQANHAYAAGAILKAAGHFWSSSGGTSGGGGAPNFAGNIGGTVVDNTITWTDEGVIPTTGSVHAYAFVAST